MSRSSDRHARPGAGALAAPVALALFLVLIEGCGTGRHGALVPDQRPVLTISSGPIERGTSSYRVRVDWNAFDPDGQVVQVLYAADPPFQGDTAWVVARQNYAIFAFVDTTVSPSPPVKDTIVYVGPPAEPSTIVSGYHSVVLKAVDNDGKFSLPVQRSFTAVTVAPSTTILAPAPTREIAISTTPSLVIQWRGVDPDGATGLPVRYAWALARADSINPANPNGVTQAAIQEFFGRDAATRYASWSTLDGTVTEIAFQDLMPSRTYYFAIVAFDETGAFEPRFSGDSNVLAFRPTLNSFGPIITVFNAYFARTQYFGGLDQWPSRIVPFAMPAGVAMPFNWSAQPGTQGTYVTGYRWALDLADSNIADTTARAGPGDVTHWSDWSPRVMQATVGPFASGPGSPSDHLLYIEAQDYFGRIALFALDLQIVTFTPTRPLLVVDDMYGSPTMRSATPPYVNLINPYPMEAEQDSFYYARGGYPDSLRILSGHPGAISTPGSFVDFDYDTLDYGFFPHAGISFADLAPYQVVCWYSDSKSAGFRDAKFGGTRPMTAIRLMNSINHENTLALYLGLGGKVWLFGDGTTTAIANGYYSRYSLSAIPPLPYAAGADPKAVLQPGDFLWDFCHLRSEVDLADRATTTLSANARLIACLPYLPQYALPRGQPVPADRSLDARVGASAQKTLDHGWGSLPRLTVFPYHGIGTDPVTGFGSVSKTAIVSKPLFATEGAGASFTSVMDTLYLCQSLQYDPYNTDNPTSDGFPNALDYHGSEHGEVVWFGFPLYDFPPDQARTATRAVLTHLGVPLAAPGAGGAHAFRARGATPARTAATNLP